MTNQFKRTSIDKSQNCGNYELLNNAVNPVCEIYVFITHNNFGWITTWDGTLNDSIFKWLSNSIKKVEEDFRKQL